jgi:putative endonuclease
LIDGSGAFGRAHVEAYLSRPTCRGPPVEAHLSLRGAKRRGNLPPVEHRYFVYIMTNRRHTVLYTGVTNDLVRRTFQHREKTLPGFTSRYNADKLVFYEEAIDVLEAIAREKQIKGGSRRKKIALIDEMNPLWQDLYDDLG